MSTPSFDLSKTRHELRTPINHIIGYCEMLLEEERLPERFYEDLRHIHTSGKRLLELIAHHFDERTVGDPKNLQELQHEVRTPVNHIIGYSELLEDHATEIGLDRLAPDLQRIRHAASQWLLLMEENLIPAEVAADPHFAEGVAMAPLLAFVMPGISFHTMRPRSADTATHWKASILVVDDDAANRDLLTRRLQRYGATVATADDGIQALQQLRRGRFDLVLLDLLLPGLDGYQVLVKAKADPKLRDVPIIMISGLDQENGIARCLEAGAEDYLTKPFNAAFLKARIGACLEKKHWRDQEQATYQALLKSQQHLASELAEAAAYVQSQLPAPLTGVVRTDWRFLPSAQLGGDAFDYFWLDDEHFAFYLLDVSSHGVGAALLSISVMNLLRTRALPDTDFRDPAAVLGALNEAFQMDRQNNMFFTFAYGVFDKRKRRLSYASGGHPPALLLTGPDRRSARRELLTTHGPLIGGMPGVRFTAQHVAVEPFARLFLFSDGAYEIGRADGRTMTVEELIDPLAGQTAAGQDDLDAVVAFLRRQLVTGRFEDDLSLLRVDFGD